MRSLWTRGRWPKAFAVGIVLSASLAAAQWMRAGEERDYLEVYLADAPTDFRNVNVCVARVWAGEHEVPLRRSQLDLLAHRGRANPALVAAGWVPGGPHRAFTIDLCGVRGNLGSAWIDVAVPDRRLRVLNADPVPRGEAGGAVLLDIDLDRSLQLTARGFEMRPHVAGVYVHDFARDGGVDRRSAPDGALSTGGFPHPPQVPQQWLEDGPRFEHTASPTSSASNQAGSASTTTASSSDECASCDGAADGTTHTQEDVPIMGSWAQAGCSPAQNLESFCGVPEGVVRSWIVHLHEEGRQHLDPWLNEDQAAALSEEALRLANQTGPLGTPRSSPVAGPTVPAPVLETVAFLMERYGFPLEGIGRFDAFFVARLASEQAHLLCREAAVERCEVVRDLLPSVDAQTRAAIRSEAFLLPGRDGRGVGVAVLDSGVDATHPALPYRTGTEGPGGVRANFLVGATGMEDLPNTDVHGHGTHVASLVAGRTHMGLGTLSEAGLAPGASLYVWSLGAAPTTATAALALDHLLHLASLDRADDRVLSPDVRIVQNAWTLPGPYDPSLTVHALVRRAVEDFGMLVVFAAGNDGGDGSQARTNAMCHAPLEGILCVGAVDATQAGPERAGIRVAPFSARGAASDAATWPDLVAPGAGLRGAKPFAVAPNDPSQPWDVYHQTLSGTSMASALVSGCAALVWEAWPHLSAAEVQRRLTSTAYKFGTGWAVDSDARYHGSHWAKGHGLLDCAAAAR